MLMIQGGNIRPHQQAVKNGFEAIEVPLGFYAGTVVGDKVELFIGEW
jgi:hypothetical protein